MGQEVTARRQIEVPPAEARGYFVPASTVRHTFTGLLDALHKLGHHSGTPVMAMVQTAERDILTMSWFISVGDK